MSIKSQQNVFIDIMYKMFINKYFHFSSYKQ